MAQSLKHRKNLTKFRRNKNYQKIKKILKKMEKDESQTDIINRILSRLPPRETEKNITALKKLVKDEEDINPVSFEFIELEDSFKKKFLATPYTLHDERDDCYR